MQLLRGRTGSVETLAISPDSRFVVASGEYSNCHVWDLSDAKPKPRKLLSARASCSTLGFASATGLLGCVDEECWRYDLAAGTQVEVAFPNAASKHAAIFHPSGELFKACGYWRGRMRRILTVRFAKGVLETVGLGTNASGHPVLYAFNPDGSRYFVREGYPDDVRRGCHLRDTATDRVVATFDQPAGWMLFESAPWAFTPDGRRVLVAASHSVLVYDCDAGGPPVLTLPHPVPGGLFNALAVHPDGRRVATVEDRRTVTFRDADTLQPLRSYDFAMPRITCVAFTPDGTRCVIGNSRGKVLLFDTE